MKQEGLSEELIEDFLEKVDRVRKGETGIVNWEEVQDLIPSEDEISLEDIQAQYKVNPSSLSKLAVIKLNGGLGTSMGLDKAKSLAVVKDELSFLEIIMKQLMYVREKYNIEVPLILMDSFNTQKDCTELINKLGFKQKLPHSFIQNKVPRILQKNFHPIDLEDKKQEWCPPGHGDIYLSLKQSGILQMLLDSGYEYAFLSNGDNLGATIEPHILEYLLDKKLEFVMEMTPKTLADKKGGAIYRKVVNGNYLGLELLETAQVPADHEHEFSGMGKFRTFSTNNLWIHLPSLKKRLEEGRMKLSLIVNPKNIEGMDVYQLETAMGSAIGNFSKTKGIIIPRTRFAPVKKCEDILIRRSDSYILQEDYSLIMNPKRQKKGMEENLVTLDEKFYKKISDFEKRFIHYPSLIDSISFTVEGEFIFDSPIILKGNVTFQNKSSQPIRISSLDKKEFIDETVSIT
ncbi:MAG: UTP--glucose-1-phosphate uridylyltransferase [Leptospiraceae bacterium]|nr:UTP--glucose-1-phosphate uridylyltransferase [Leptospiraceae bacterium]